MPAPITAIATPVIVNGNEDSGRKEEQAGGDEDDQTDETSNVESHALLLDERVSFSSSFAQGPSLAYWTFAAGLTSNCRSLISTR